MTEGDILITLFLCTCKGRIIIEDKKEEYCTMLGFVCINIKRNWLIFIETDYKTKCKSIMERIEEIANREGFSGMDNLYIERAELIVKGNHIEMSDGRKPIPINGYDIRIQTLKELQLGRLWLTRTTDGMTNVMRVDICKPDGICIRSFKTYPSAIYYLCNVVGTPFNVQIHYKESKEDTFYRYLTFVDDPDNLDTALWNAKGKYSLLLSYMISNGSDTHALEICKIRENKVVRLGGCLLDDYKELKHTVIPYIIGVAERRSKLNAAGINGVRCKDGL